MSKCLRCGATSEWIQGKVNDEPSEIEAKDRRIAELEAEAHSREQLIPAMEKRIAELEAELAKRQCVSSPSGVCQIRRAQEFAGDPRIAIAPPDPPKEPKP